MKQNWLNDWRLLLLACLTLGLAPYAPEPHIWGKIRWVAGGAKGMAPMDWFDLVLHGTPWVLLGIWALRKVFKQLA
ncbi:MAG: hypothetical protein H6555_09115 [Lewinellaceae bacterium]|nr:hypothetical protein [Lewinellaceae bacterium]